MNTKENVYFKRKKKKNRKEKRSDAAVLLHPLNYINTDSKGALQAFAGTKIFHSLIFLMQPMNFSIKKCRGFCDSLTYFFQLQTAF